jgi:hypothetical protein
MAIALVGSVVTVLLAACGSGSDQAAGAPVEAAARAQAEREALTAGRWRIQVSVRPSRIGPIVFVAKNLSRAKPTDANPWIEHELVFRNTGDRPITFADTKHSEFASDAGHNRLLVADQGCGYELDNAGAPVKPGACLAYLDLLEVQPHTSTRRSITLFKELPGMDRLAAGIYVFRRPVRFQLGRRQPGEAEGRSRVIRVEYKVATRPRSTPTCWA